MIFHVLAITFNTKTRFWNYEMTTYNPGFILVYFIFFTAVIILQESVLFLSELAVLMTVHYKVY